MSREAAEHEIARTRSLGFKFAYLLNASPLVDEFGASRRSIIEEIEWIGEVADSVVLTSPYLVELCRKHAPRLDLTSSILAHIDNPVKARRWAEFGITKIAPDWNTFRDFRLLESMVQAVKPLGARLEILVNDPCLIACPYTLCHDLAMAKGSATQTYEHYWTLRCCRDYVSSPVEIVRSLFVRPEDLYHYENIGIEDFKIADRNRPTQFIVSAVKAYRDRHYEGNLADILSIFSSEAPHCAEADVMKDALSCDALESVEGRDRFWKHELRPLMGVKIDNRQLDGFLNHFVKQDSCCSANCTTCRYCDTWAARAVSLGARETAIARLDEALNAIHTGD